MGLKAANITTRKTQITVRLDDSAVALLDELAKQGLGSSRADALNRILRRERRRQAALRDAEIYRTAGENPDLAGIAEVAQRTPLDD